MDLNKEEIKVLISIVNKERLNLKSAVSTGLTAYYGKVMNLYDKINKEYEDKYNSCPYCTFTPNPDTLEIGLGKPIVENNGNIKEISVIHNVWNDEDEKVEKGYYLFMDIGHTKMKDKVIPIHNCPVCNRQLNWEE